MTSHDTWFTALIYSATYSLYEYLTVCCCHIFRLGLGWKAHTDVDTRIYHRCIMSGLDNISVPHPPVRSWSTGTPPAAWIPPGRTFASGSVWTSCWNPVGPSVDVSDRRSLMLRERPELRESPPPTVRKTDQYRAGPSLRVSVSLKSYLKHSSEFSPVNSFF